MLAREEIQAQFHALIAPFEKGDLTPVATTLAPEISMETSNLGDAHGRAEILSTLNAAAPASQFSRYHLTNEYIAVASIKAQHSVYLTAAVIQGVSTSWFGGHFANSWDHAENGWHISTIRFELDWVYGSHPTLNSWPTPRNQLGWAPGAPLPKPLSALDGPWHVLPHSDELGSDEQQIVDAFTRYTWAVDQWDLSLMDEIFADDLYTNISPFGPLRSKREFLSTLLLFRTGRPYLHHAMGATEVEVDGDTARLQVYRLVPYGATPELLERNIFGAIYDCTLQRVDGTWVLKASPSLRENFSKSPRNRKGEKICQRF
ncbi:nuclear transport factor 2 family protein [Corynebacterium callunae]|uniref:nuclear transport factor 2 family protein n=1 Tax=Corynebacterium callunae TaxID=1721 RepID=UPI003982B925